MKKNFRVWFYSGVFIMAEALRLVDKDDIESDSKLAIVGIVFGLLVCAETWNYLVTK